MGTRRELPPRPPLPPKVGLGQLKGRQHSTGSISIRFNAASADDYGDDDEMLSIQTGSSQPLDVRSDDVFATSKSAPVSEVTTPESPTPGHLSYVPPEAPGEPGISSPPPEGEKSVLRGLIREKYHKYQDRLPDNITAFIDRFDEPSSPESSVSKSIPPANKEPSQKVPSKSPPVKQTSMPDRRKVLQSTEIEVGLDPLSTLMGSSNHSRTPSDCSDISQLSNTCNGTRKSSDSDFTNSGKEEKGIEIVDEFFQQDDTFEDISDEFKVCQKLDGGSSTDPVTVGPARPRNLANVPSSSPGKVAKIQQFIANKHKAPAGEAPVMAVTMSGLLSKKSEDAEDEDVVYDGDSIVSTDVDFRELDQLKGPGKKAEVEEEENKQSPEKKEEELPSSDTKQPDRDDLTKSNIPFQRLISIGVGFLAYIIIPLPTFISGFILGVFFCWVGMVIYQWLWSPPVHREPFVLPDLESLPPLQVPEMKEAKNTDGKFKAWMNELSHYNVDDYHINQTHSVYIQLEGTIIRLQRPKHSISKRAMWNEPHVSPTFVHQRHYDLVGSKVQLLPQGLIKKRMWSKKYPLCVTLPEGVKVNKSMLVQESQDPSGTASAAKELQKSVEEEAPPSNGNSDRIVLYLFARTGKEKEEWYRRLDAASKGCPMPIRFSDLLPTSPIEVKRPPLTASSSLDSSTPYTKHGSLEHGSCPSLEDLAESDSLPSTDRKPAKYETLTTYMQYMGKIMPNTKSPTSDKATTPNGSKKFSPPAASSLVPLLCEPQILWVNSILSRCFWDFLREDYWAEKMKEKIQKKLSKIHVPYFIDELTVTDIVLGTEMPIIRRASKPYLDDRGLWIDLDVVYNGGFYMGVETKINLMKLKKTSKTTVHDKSQKKRSPITDSEEEDSAESSTDEEGEEITAEKVMEESPTPGGSTGKKFLRIVDKIAASKYFQQATENKYIKRAMEGVSNTRLMLTVELRSCVGTVAINIPPPPTDRIWYGFRNNPQVWLTAKPKVGEREVTVTHVTDWIEKKLTTEFQRVLVMPNMDDLPIPLMFDDITVACCNKS